MPKKNSKLLLIIGSLVIAIGLWAYIMGEESVEVRRKVPLIIKTPDGITVANEVPDKITVQLLVPRNFLSLLENQPIVVEHEIKGITEFGKVSFDFSNSDVKRPSSVVRVQQIIPERMVVTLDEVINKRLPIEANLINDPAAGFKVEKDGVQIDPNAVLVSGAKSVLTKMEAIQTEPIDIIGRIRSFRKKVVLQEKRDYTIINKSLIDIFVPIKEEYALKQFTDVPVKVLSASRAIFESKITPEKVDISLRGPQKGINAIQKEQILAYVNVVNLDVGKYQLPLLMSLPSDIVLDQSNPIIDVEIREAVQK